jgi:hypothetical protein
MSRLLYWLLNCDWVTRWLIHHGWDYTLVRRWHGGGPTTYSVRVRRYRKPVPFPCREEK